MPMEPRTAVIYCRISRDRTGEALGVERQVKDCRKLARAHGLEVVGEYVDDDLSAYSGKTRPAYEALCLALKEGGVSTLLAWHPDRLTRQPSELERLITVLEASGATVKTCVAGDYDLGTDSGKMIARILGDVATHESDHKRTRLKRKHQELAERGAWQGGTRMFGYEMPSGKIIAAEAKAIRLAAKMILEGQTIKAITRAWNDAGITTTRGNLWVSSAVRAVMIRPSIAGLRVYQGEVIGQASWKPIIDVETFEHVKAILTNPARRTAYPTARKHLLVGFIYCQCGAKMKSALANKKFAYRCQTDDSGHGCGKVTIVGQPVDDLVKALVIQRLTDADNVEVTKPTDSAAAKLVTEAQEVRAKMERLEDAYVEGTITKPRYLKLHASLRDASEGLEARLSAFHGKTVRANLPKSVKAVEALWETESLDWQRARVNEAITKVTILPGNPHRRGFVSERIVPTLR